MGFAESKAACEGRGMVIESNVRTMVKAGKIGAIEAMLPSAVGGMFTNASRQQSNSRAAYKLLKNWVFAASNVTAKRCAGQPWMAGHYEAKPENTTAAKKRRRKAFLKSADQPGEIKHDKNHEVLWLLDKPNRIQGKFEFIYITVMNLLLTGEWYWIGGVTKKGEAEVWAVPSSWIVPDHKDGMFTGYKLQTGYGEGVPLKPENVARGYFPDPSDIKGCISPLASCVQAANIDDFILTSQEKSFERGINPNLILTVGSNIGPDGKPTTMRPVLKGFQRRQLIRAVRQIWNDTVNQGEPAILDGLIDDVKKFQLTPQEMDWKQSGEIVKARVFQAFGVNAIIVGEITPSNKAQAVVAETSFCSQVVNPILSNISTAAAEFFGQFYDDGESLAVWLEEAVPKDDEREDRQWAQARQQGDVTQDEVRARLKLEPLEKKPDRSPIFNNPQILASITGLAAQVTMGALSHENAVNIAMVSLQISQADADAMIPDDPPEPTPEELAAQQAAQSPFGGGPPGKPPQQGAPAEPPPKKPKKSAKEFRLGDDDIDRIAIRLRQLGIGPSRGDRLGQQPKSPEIDTATEAGIIEAGYDPSQPRDESGQWSSSGGSASDEYHSLIERIGQPDGGFTYQPVTEESPTTGYALSPYPERSFAKAASELNEDDLIEFVEKNADLLLEQEHFLGAWHDPASGKVFLDVSIVTHDRERAEQVAKEKDQIAYFDLDKKESVTVNANATSGGAAGGKHVQASTSTDAGKNDRRSTGGAVQEIDGPGNVTRKEGGSREAAGESQTVRAEEFVQFTKTVETKIARAAVKAAYAQQHARVERQAAKAFAAYFQKSVASIVAKLPKSFKPDPDKAKEQAAALVKRAFKASKQNDLLIANASQPVADAFLEGAYAEMRLSAAAKRRKKGYNPDQPRNPDGTFGSGGSSSGNDEELAGKYLKVTKNDDGTELTMVSRGLGIPETSTPGKIYRKTLDLLGLPGEPAISMYAYGHNGPIKVMAEDESYKATRYVMIDDKEMENNSLEVFKQQGGTGTKILADQVEAASRDGFKKITTYAAKGQYTNGYYTWARLGYDCPINRSGEFTDKVKSYATLHSLKNVSDFMKSGEHRAWWKENGEAFHGSFDLTEGSQSRKVLEAYVQAKREQATAKSSRESTGTDRGGRSSSGSNLGQPGQHSIPEGSGVKITTATQAARRAEQEIDFPTTAPEWLTEAAQDFIIETFQEDYWLRIPETTRDDIELTLYEAIRDGKSIRDIVSDITDAHGDEYSKWRATNVARTECTGAMNSGAVESMRQAYEGTGLEPAKEWLSVMGTTTRETHADADGQTVPLDAQFTVGGYPCSYPGDITLPPQERCQCQCSIVSAFVGESISDDEEGKAYDPDQPRDDHGMWTGTGGSSPDTGDGTGAQGTSPSEPAPAAESAAPKVLTGSNKIQEWAIQHFPAGQKYSEPEVDAIMKYTGTGFSRINSGLRKNSGDTEKLQSKKTVEGLDSAIKRGTVPEDVMVYRGIKTAKLVENLKVGDTFKDHGYPSTSLQRKVGERFGKAAVMEIKVPKGVNALAVDSIFDGGSNYGEHELVLPRGASFKITGVKTSGGKKIISAEYVP